LTGLFEYGRVALKGKPMNILEGITHGDRGESRRIISYIKNGKGTIYHCGATGTYWRTLKAAKELAPHSKQIKQPRYV